MKIENIKLGFSSPVRIANGTQLKDIMLSELQNLQRLSIGKDKNNEPALYVYTGIKGEYNPTQCAFADIDTTEGVDCIINRADDIFSNIPFIYCMQKSFSGKLHIIFLLPKIAENPDEWESITAPYTKVLVWMLGKLTGYNYFLISDGKDTQPGPALDYHNTTNWKQPLFVSPNEFIYNPYPTPITISTTDIDRVECECDKIVKENYPDYYEKQFKNNNAKTYQRTNQYSSDTFSLEIKTDVIEGYEIDYNGEKLTINDNFCVGEYKGNELRWRISSLLYNICGGDKVKAQSIAESLFNRTRKNNYQEWKKFYNKGINTVVRDWFIMTFCKKKDNKPSDELTTIAGISLDEWKSLGLIV